MKKYEDYDWSEMISGLGFWVLVHPAIMFVLWTYAVKRLLATGNALDGYLAFIVIVFMFRSTSPHAASAPEITADKVIIVADKEFKEGLKEAQRARKEEEDRKKGNNTDTNDPS